MEKEANFSNLGLPDDSELDKTLKTSTTIKPRNDNYTRKVVPLVDKELVKIDNELFKKVLFFMIYFPAVGPFNTDTLDDYFYNNSPSRSYNPQRLFYMNFKSSQRTGEVELFSIATKGGKLCYLNHLTGFVETVIVFFMHLITINFYKVNTEISVDKYNFSRIEMFDDSDKKESGPVGKSFERGWRFFFNKNGNADDILLGRLLYIAGVDKLNMYRGIEFNFDDDKGFLKEEIDIRTTQKELNTLSNYVELLEKLIKEEIVIKLIDGELFANDTKIGFKNNILNKAKKLCTLPFKRTATIYTGDDNANLYGTILSVYRDSLISENYNLNILDSNLCGGRNNKTRKRHKNKASHKKMRKSHNIRKRKATGKKRK